MLADQEEQAAAAVEVAAVEARVGVSGLRRPEATARPLSRDAGRAVGEELDQLGPADDRRARDEAAFSSSFRFLKQGEQTKILPPAFTKFSMSSCSGAKPSSRMSSA